MMETAVKKARVLIEALPYMQAFREAVIVIKLGGSAMEDAAHVRAVLQDVVFMECVGMRPVIVHGGGKAISRGMRRAGLQATFLHGLRVTCDRTIGIVESVLKTEVNPVLVDTINAMGGKAVALHGDTILTAARNAGIDPATGDPLDWGYVGEPTAVDSAPIRTLLEQDRIPVITPLGRGPEGRVYNMNADVAAAAIAAALPARKLVFLSDVPGLLTNPDDPSTLIETLRAGELEALIDRGTIAGGMLPKCRSGVEALHAGVNKVHMVDGRASHSLLLEIFTDQGVGTQIVKG